jgi:hypothetical protein
MSYVNGRGRIRTHGRLAPTAVFKTAALGHSATLPVREEAIIAIENGGEHSKLPIFGEQRVDCLGKLLKKGSIFAGRHG